MNEFSPLILSNTAAGLESPDIDPILDEHFGCHCAWETGRVDGEVEVDVECGLSLNVMNRDPRGRSPAIAQYVTRESVIELSRSTVQSNILSTTRYLRTTAHDTCTWSSLLPYRWLFVVQITLSLI